MVAVHRRLERPHHPGQGLDRHLDAGAEATGGGEQHVVDGPSVGGSAAPDWVAGTVSVIASEATGGAVRSGAPDPDAVRPVLGGVAASTAEAALRRTTGSGATCAQLAGVIRGRRGSLAGHVCPPRRRVAPGSPAERVGLLPGDEILTLNGEVPRDVIPYRCSPTRPSSCSTCAGRSRARADRREAGGRAARRRGQLRPVRPGPHLRQPLRVLLHLPAAARAAEEPLPQGRRLPAVVPLRELHDAHPLHRGRPRAGGHRAALAAQRAHPRHRPRGAHRHAAQPARRHEPPVAAGPARPRHRGPRADRRVPGPSTTAPSSTTPSPASSTASPSWPASASCRSASAATTPRPPCGPHTAAEAAAVVDAVHDWQDIFLPPLGHRLVFAADEYYLLAGRAVPRAGRVRRLPDARGRRRHGPHLRARVHRRRRPGHRRGPGFFAWVDGAPPEGYRAPRTTSPPVPRRWRPRPPHPVLVAMHLPMRPQTSTRTARSHDGDAQAPPSRTGRHPHRHLRRRRARSAGRRPRPRRRPGDPGREPVLRRQHRGRRPADGRGPRPGPGRPSPTATATCCPTSACRRDASSTAPRPRSCPVPSRSSPPMASPSGLPWRTDDPAHDHRTDRTDRAV